MVAELRSEPASEYFSKTGIVSRSMLATFRKRRRLYEQQYVLGMLPEEPPTDAMLKGTVAHGVLLEGKSIDEMVCEIPREVLNADGHKKGAAWKAFAAANAGKDLLKAEEIDKATAAVKAVLDHPILGKWMSVESKREWSCYWQDDETGLELRCRPDWIIERPDAVYVFDFKFVNDSVPQEFRRSIERGLWLQDRMYSDGLFQHFRKPLIFQFAVIDSDAPHTVSIQAIDDDAKTLGDSAYHRTLRQLRLCRDSGNYSDPHERVVSVHSLRPFAFEDSFEEEFVHE